MIWPNHIPHGLSFDNYDHKWSNPSAMLNKLSVRLNFITSVILLLISFTCQLFEAFVFDFVNHLLIIEEIHIQFKTLLTPFQNWQTKPWNPKPLNLDMCININLVIKLTRNENKYNYIFSIKSVSVHAKQ